MHKKMIEEASFEQLKCFALSLISMLKERNKDLYEDAEDLLYRMIYGEHFSEWSLKIALENMINEDGTHGGHWTLEETTSVAKQYGVDLNYINQYDWCYLLNMIYSDYYGVIPNETSSYVKLAKKFVHDKDAPKEKIYRYYEAMKR